MAYVAYMGCVAVFFKSRLGRGIVGVGAIATLVLGGLPAVASTPSDSEGIDASGGTATVASEGVAAASTSTVFGAEVVRIFNEERAKYGLKPLVHLQAVQEATQSFTESWVTKLENGECLLENVPVNSCHLHHLPAEYSKFVLSTGWDMPLDNQIGGASSEARAAQGWLGSPGHRAVVLDNNGDHPRTAVGVGRVGNYWTVIMTGDPRSTVDWTPAQPSETDVVVAGTIQIAGSPVEGGTLTAVEDGWQPSGTTLSYRWLRNGQEINYAFDKTYRPTDLDVGQSVSVRVTGSYSGYKATSATSAPVTVKAKEAPVTITGPTPTISGSTKPGSTLSVSAGAWTPSGVSLSYQWMRDGASIAGATSSTYKTATTDAGRKITVRVTGSLPGATALSRTSQAVTIEKATTPTPSRITANRLSGASRYDTNLAVNRQTMQSGKPVFVVTGSDFPDALSVGPAVAQSGGSLFLVAPSGLSSQQIALLQQKKPNRIYLIGGTGVVSTRVEAQAKAIATTSRISGSDRYATSQKVADTFFPNATQALVATGTNFPDALSGAAAGGTLGAPVLLASNAKIPNLKNKTNVYVLGGESVVSQQVFSRLAATNKSVTRLYGSTRYDTNAAVNKMLGGNPSTLYVATGTNFPDALSAGGPSGMGNARLVLSNGKCVRGAQTGMGIFLVGGTAVLPLKEADIKGC